MITESDIKPTSTAVTSGLQGSDVPEATPNATQTAAINAKTEKAEALLDKDGNANPPAKAPTTTDANSSSVSPGDSTAAKDSDEGKTERRSRSNTLRSLLDRADMVTGIVEDKTARKDSKEPKDDKVVAKDPVSKDVTKDVTKDTKVVDDKPKTTTSTSSPATKTTSGSGSSPGSSEKEKVSKMERLKEKLHIGHKHKEETK